MLVLTRKLGERVKIGPDITLIVVGISAGQVRLAIEAPPEIPIHRQEVYDAIHEGASKPETNVASRS